MECEYHIISPPYSSFLPDEKGPYAIKPLTLEHRQASAGGEELIGSALIYLLAATMLMYAFARAQHTPGRTKQRGKRLSAQTMGLACLLGPIPVLLKKRGSPGNRPPKGLLAIMCVFVAVLESDLTHADLRQGMVQILRDHDVVLARNVAFQKKATCFPHRIDIVAASTLSYGALERAPTFLEQAADHIRETYAILQRANSTRRNLAEPAVLPKYKIPYPDVKVKISEARLQCEAMGLTLAAPRNTTELRELQAWALQHGAWTAPNERIWLDCEFSLHEQALINMLTKERLDLIYPGVDAKADHMSVDGWTHNLDDHTSQPALILQSGQLDFTQVEGISMYGDGYGRGYINKVTGGAAPVSHVVCQSFGMKRDNVLIAGELVSARDLYAKQNARLPLEALRDTENFLTALAAEERRQIRELIERYGLKRLPQTVIPPLVSQSIVPPEGKPLSANSSEPFYRTPLSGTRAGNDPKPHVNGTWPNGAPTVVKNLKRAKRETADYDWDSSDDAGRVLLSIAKAVPVFGLAADAVDTILRERKLYSFQQTTSKRLRNLERTIAKSARRLSEIKFAADVLDHRVTNLELSVKQMQDHVSATLMSLELNQRLDLVHAQSQALHAEFLIKINEFDRWLSALRLGKTPDQMFSGRLLDSVRELIRDLGLSARAELQQTTSTIVQDPVRIDALQIISNIRVSDVPWTLYEMAVLPTWQNNHLYQEQVDFKFLAIDRNMMSFIVLSQQEFEQCKDTACILPNPVRPLRTAPCGPIALVGGPPSPTCTVTELPAVDFYHPFGMALTYSVREPQKVSLVCPYEDSTPRRKVISGSGICIIPRGCHLTTPDGNTYYGPPSSGLPVTKEHSFNCIDTTDLDLEPVFDNYDKYWAIMRISTSDITPIYVTIGVVVGLVLLFVLACIYFRTRRDQADQDDPRRQPRYRVGPFNQQQGDNPPPRCCPWWRSCAEFCHRPDVLPEVEQGNAQGPAQQAPPVRLGQASPPIPILQPREEPNISPDSSSLHATAGSTEFQSVLNVEASNPRDPPPGQAPPVGHKKHVKSAISATTLAESPAGADAPLNSTTHRADKSAETAKRWKHFNAVPPEVVTRAQKSPSDESV